MINYFQKLFICTPIIQLKQQNQSNQMTSVPIWLTKTGKDIR